MNPDFSVRNPLVCCSRRALFTGGSFVRSLVVRAPEAAMLTVKLLAARVLEAAMLTVRSLVVLACFRGFTASTEGSHVNYELTRCAVKRIVQDF